MFAPLAWLTGYNEIAQPVPTDYTALLCQEVKQRIIDFIEPRDAVALLRVNNDWRHAVTDRLSLHGQLTKVGRPVRPYEKMQGSGREGTPVQLRDALLSQRRRQLQRERGACDIFAIDVGSPKDGALSVSFAPDAKLAVVYGTRARTELWVLEKGRVGSQLLGPKSTTTFAALFSPSGQQVAVASSANRISLYQLGGQTPIVCKAMTSERPWQALLFSPDGNALFMADAGGAMALWDIKGANAKATPFFEAAGMVRAWTFSEDGKRLAASLVNQTIQVFDTHASTPQLIAILGNHPSATTFHFSQDNAHLVTGVSGGMTRLYEVAKPEKAQLFLNNNYAAVVRLATFIDHDRVLLTVGSNGSVQVCDWNTSSRDSVGIIKDDAVGFVSANISSDKQHLVTVSHYRDCDVVKVWNLSQAKPEAAEWRLKGETLLGAQFSEDGRFVMAPSAQGRVHMCDFDMVLAGIHAPSAQAVAPKPWWYRLLGWH